MGGGVRDGEGSDLSVNGRGIEYRFGSYVYDVSASESCGVWLPVSEVPRPQVLRRALAVNAGLVDSGGCETCGADHPERKATHMAVTEMSIFVASSMG